MKMLILSDLHLTHRFDKRKFEHFKKVISQAENVIINGDFWDGYLTTFDKFVNSSWKELFPLLKEKNTVYIFGNHDRSHWTDERVNLFSVKQTDKLELDHNGKTCIIQHGHALHPAVDDRFPFLANKWTAKLASAYYFIGVKLFGRYFFPNIHPLAKRTKRKMKRWAKKNLGDDMLLICGHSHCGEVDLKNRYVNTGYMQHGYAQCIVMNENEIALLQHTY